MDLKCKLVIKFRFLPDLATADIAFAAYGRDRAELLENAALALEEAMVDTKAVAAKIKELLALQADSLPEMLFCLLEELIFLKDVKNLVFGQFKFEVHKQKNSLQLQGEAWGEKIDPQKHKLKVDVKAVTKHLFKVDKTKTGYKAQVILDI